MCLDTEEHGDLPPFFTTQRTHVPEVHGSFTVELQRFPSTFAENETKGKKTRKLCDAEKISIDTVKNHTHPHITSSYRTTQQFHYPSNQGS